MDQIVLGAILVLILVGYAAFKLYQFVSLMKDQKEREEW